jgi:hypothetical protein
LFLFLFFINFYLHAEPELSSKQKVQLDARVEGLYAIQLTCKSEAKSCDPTVMRLTDRISIIDSHGKTGVWVTIASSVSHFMLGTYQKSKVGPSPTSIIARSNSNGDNPSRFAYIEIHTNPDTGELTGSLIDVRTSASYSIHGQSMNRVGDLVGHANDSFDISKLVGRYHGVAAGAKGELTIMQLPDLELVASFSSDDKVNGLPEFTMQFDTIRWDPELDVLQLTEVGNHLDEEAEINLVIEPGSPIHLKGFYVTGMLATPAEMIKQ